MCLKAWINFRLFRYPFSLRLFFTFCSPPHLLCMAVKCKSGVCMLMWVDCAVLCCEGFTICTRNGIMEQPGWTEWMNESEGIANKTGEEKRELLNGVRIDDGIVIDVNFWRRALRKMHFKTEFAKAALNPAYCSSRNWIEPGLKYVGLLRWYY